MNKKKLVKALMNRMQIFGYFPSFTNVKIFIREYEKLTNSEPQKPVVPQFVADWLSKLKSGLFGLNYDSVPSEIYDWVYATEDNLRKLHLAFVYGYEVEKEKRYEVILCNGQSLKTVYRQGEDRLDFEKVYGDLERFTRKQLEEAGFGWVFDCPGIEVEEVE
jgi:hypothetical protein